MDTITGAPRALRRSDYVDFATLRRRYCSLPLPVSCINLFPGAAEESNFAGCLPNEEDRLPTPMPMGSPKKPTAAKRRQYGALPYRLRAGSRRPQFMLITSRENQRWVIPKGWPKKGKSPHGSAAREAFEEAGV